MKTIIKKANRWFNKIVGATTLVALAATSQANTSDDMKHLNFGIISTESSQNLKTAWVPFLKEMEKRTGMTIKPFFAPDYAGIIQAMRFNKVDIAWYGNKSAIEAVDRAGGEVFAQTVDVNGNPGYWSLLVAHKDSALNNVDDILKNASSLSFANGDPNSTSGYLVPSYYVFAKNKVEPKKIFKTVTNSGHEANLLSVANKRVDFATNNTENLSRLEVTHPEKLKNIKVLWKSPLIPADPILWRKNLPESTKSKVYDFFMSYGQSGDEKELKILKNLQWAPFKASSDDQLLPVRQLVLFKNKLKAENSRLSAKDKSEKINAFNEQLASLNRKMAALDARD